MWTGAVYHGKYLAPLNWAAWLSGTLFMPQGVLLAWAGLLRGRMALPLAGLAGGLLARQKNRRRAATGDHA